MQNSITSTSTESGDLLHEFASKNELADLFRVSPRTIERWVRLRTIPHPVRLGRRSLFHLPTIREALTNAATNDPRRSKRRRP